KVCFFGMYRAWGRLLTNRQDRARTYHVLRGTLPATSRYSPQSAAPRRATWLPRLDKAQDRVTDDPAGTYLLDESAALYYAAYTIQELRKKSGYEDDLSLMVIVKDQAGQTVLPLPFFPGC